MAKRKKPKTNLEIRHLLPSAIIVSFTAAIFLPSPGDNTTITSSITFIGILFGVIVGFFIVDLYSRYTSIRANAAQDSSCLSTMYAFAVIIASENNDKAWLHTLEDRIEKYIHIFMPLRWEEYGKTEKAFEDIGKSLEEVKYEGAKANQTYNNMLSVYNGHSTARESLVMFGKDRLTWGEWISTLILGSLLLVSLFYIKTDNLTSILFTGSIATAILVLFIVLRDLDNLNTGENEVSVEPYERVLDAIGRPRYYRSKE